MTYGISISIEDRNLVVDLVEGDAQGDALISRSMIPIEDLFDVHTEIMEERRVAHARHQSNPDRYPKPRI